MGRDEVHTVHRAGKWVNEAEDGVGRTFHHTKEEAVAAGRLRARVNRTDHVVHDEDGTIAYQESYTGDRFAAS